MVVTAQFLALPEMKSVVFSDGAAGLIRVARVSVILEMVTGGWS